MGHGGEGARHKDAEAQEARAKDEETLNKRFATCLAKYYCTCRPRSPLRSQLVSSQGLTYSARDEGSEVDAWLLRNAESGLYLVIL